MLGKTLYFFRVFCNTILETLTETKGGILMGKFTTGVVAGTMLGIGMMLVDKKTIKKMKKMAHKMPCYLSWM